MHNRWINDESVILRGGIQLNDFASLDLEKNESFIYPDNLLPFVKDTAISLLRSESIHAYYQYTESNKLPGQEGMTDLEEEAELLKDARNKSSSQKYPLLAGRRMVLAFLFMNSLPDELAMYIYCMYY